MAPSPPHSGTLPLSVLVDLLAGDGPRDADFARRFSRWMHERAAFLHLAPLDALGLVDVVLTFRLRGVVTLLATGNHPEQPGEVSVRFHERDFPFIAAHIEEELRSEAYEVCTMDYSVAGRPLELAANLRTRSGLLARGTRGEAVVYTTLGLKAHLRARLEGEGEQARNLPEGSYRFVDELPVAGG